MREAYQINLINFATCPSRYRAGETESAAIRATGFVFCSAGGIASYRGVLTIAKAEATAA
jgi:hypothetical protein